MVGPTMVALLVKNTPLGYDSMAYVGLAFYAMHFPLIATAMLSGGRLLRDASDLSAIVHASSAAGEGDLEEPLLHPAHPHDGSVSGGRASMDSGVGGLTLAFSGRAASGRLPYTEDIRWIMGCERGSPGSPAA